MKFSVEISEKGNGRQVLEFDRPEVTIGRVKGNDIILPKGNISKRHSRIIVKGGAFVVVDLKSTNGTYVNGHKLTSPHVLKHGDQIYIGDFTLTVASQRDAGRTTSARTPLPRTPPVQTPPNQTPAPRPAPPRPPAAAAPPPPPPLPRSALVAPPLPSLDEDAEFIAPIEDYGDASADENAANKTGDQAVGGAALALALRAAAFATLVQGDDIDGLALDAAAAAQAVRRALDNAAAATEWPRGVDRDAVSKDLVREIIGLGPLDPLLQDSAVSKIFANDPHHIFVVRDGRTVACGDIFSSAGSMTHVIGRLLRASRLQLGVSTRIDARLADGSHLSALLPPLAANGPALVLSRPAKPTATLDLLVAAGALSQRMAEFLRTCVRLRQNIVVSNRGDQGGVDVLRAIASAIDGRERIVTIEQVAQLGLPQPNVVNLEAAPVVGERDATTRELVRWALRLEPDRLVVGDCRGGEALDIVQAMGGSLAGSLLLVHGNSAHEGTGNLEAMMQVGAGDASARAMREVLVRAIDVVVQVARFADGAPRVTEIAAVSGMEVDLITMQEIFAYRSEGAGLGGKILGRFLATGAVPHFYDEMQRRGEKLDLGLFREDT